MKPGPGAAAAYLATDPTVSAWVAASAGTGKTKLLVDRAINLLLAGAKPGKLLCLTFTKAAAREMAIRLATRLGEWTTAEDAKLADDLRELTGRAPEAALVGRARRLFAEVLDAPGGLAIDTIHAFCQSLLRRFPIEAGLAPHFEVLDERSAAELLGAARDRVLAGAREGVDAELAAALAEVARHLDETGVAGLMEQTIAERGRIQRLIRGHGGLEGLVAALRARLGLAADDSESSILAAAADQRAFDAAGLRAAAAALARGAVSDRPRGLALAAWLDDPARRVATFDDYLEVYFTRAGERRQKLATKDTLKGVPGIDAVLETEAQRLEAVIERRDAAADAASSAALLRLAAALIDAYEADKRRRDGLDYDDLILKARDLLAAPGVAPWVLFKLDGGIDHILIDEAQDTNPEQWEVVAALAEEFFAGLGARQDNRTVFAVGDPKQSIYSFQRADPAAFVRMRDHFAARARAAQKSLQPVALNLSYRSTEPVLRAVDKVFAQPRAADGVALDGQPIAHRCQRRGAAGVVELWPPVKPEDAAQPEPMALPVERVAEDSPPARLAAMIARTIAGWIGRGERLEARDRPIRASDIMILVRRRNRLVNELVRALKREGVEVAGVDRMVLAEQLAIMDLMALGRFLLLPEDDLGLATVLKGPLIGFAEDELFALAWPRRASLWAELGARAAERPAFAAAFRELAELLGRVDFVRPYELYAEILGARGGRRRIVARLGMEAEDPVDEFLAAAIAFERAHPPALETFLHWLEAGRQEIKRDLEAGGREEVRVMTVHGAKGSQAPIVILPDTLQTPERGSNLLWPEGLVVWSPALGRASALATGARAAATAAREAEYRRLLYVALTRAQDRLYICGHRTRQDARPWCWYNLVEPGLREIAKPFEFDGAGDERAKGIGLRLATPQIASRPATEDVGREPEVQANLPEWLDRPPPAEPTPPRPLVPSSPEGAEPPVRSPFGPDDGARFRRGRLIHRLLQSLPDLPAAARPAAALAFLSRPLHALPAAERTEIARETLAVLDHPQFAPLFGEGSIAEAPVVGRVGDRIVSGRLDRLLVSADEVLVVDYKTDRPAPPAAPAEVAPVYLAQMAAYRAVLARIYPGRRIRCALLWTDGPLLMELPEPAESN
ncbi:MAG: double-strand break repair helicase AddA [Pseudomonadota bacterium]